MLITDLIFFFMMLSLVKGISSMYQLTELIDFAIFNFKIPEI